MTYDRRLAACSTEAGGSGKDYTAEADAIAGLIKDHYCTPKACSTRHAAPAPT